MGPPTLLARHRHAVRGRHLSRRVGAVPRADPPVPPGVQRRHHPHPDPARGRRAPPLAVRGRPPVRRHARRAAQPARARTAPLVLVPGVLRDGEAAGSDRPPRSASAPRDPPAHPPERCARRPPTSPSARRSPARARPRPPPPSRRSCGSGSRPGSRSRPDVNAVASARPFFDHLEVWPDIVIPELRIAVEYDSTGRHGLEHVGKRRGGRPPQGPRAAGGPVGGGAGAHRQARDARPLRPAGRGDGGKTVSRAARGVPGDPRRAHRGRVPALSFHTLRTCPRSYPGRVEM